MIKLKGKNIFHAYTTIHIRLLFNCDFELLVKCCLLFQL